MLGQLPRYQRSGGEAGGHQSQPLSLKNPDHDVELKRNILAHLIHETKMPPRGHGELKYYDPQQHLPMLLAKKDDGLVNSILPDCLTALFLLEAARKG